MELHLRDQRISATIAQFCNISGLKPSTVWKLLNEGQLQSIAVGRRRLVLLSSYYEFIDRQRAGPPLDARRNKAVPELGSKATVTHLDPPLTEPEPLGLRIEDLDLSTRAANALHCDGIKRVAELVEQSGKDLLLIPNFGRRCLREVETALARLGLQLSSREASAAE